MYKYQNTVLLFILFIDNVHGQFGNLPSLPSQNLPNVNNPDTVLQNASQSLGTSPDTVLKNATQLGTNPQDVLNNVNATQLGTNPQDVLKNVNGTVGMGQLNQLQQMVPQPGNGEVFQTVNENGPKAVELVYLMGTGGAGNNLTNGLPVGNLSGPAGNLVNQESVNGAVKSAGEIANQETVNGLANSANGVASGNTSGLMDAVNNKTAISGLPNVSNNTSSITNAAGGVTNTSNVGGIVGQLPTTGGNSSLPTGEIPNVNNVSQITGNQSEVTSFLTNYVPAGGGGRPSLENATYISNVNPSDVGKPKESFENCTVFNEIPKTNNNTASSTGNYTAVVTEQADNTMVEIREKPKDVASSGATYIVYNTALGSGPVVYCVAYKCPVEVFQSIFDTSGGRVCA